MAMSPTEESLYIALCASIIDDMTSGGQFLKRRDVWHKVEQEMIAKGFREKIPHSIRKDVYNLFSRKKVSGERLIGPRIPAGERLPPDCK